MNPLENRPLSGIQHSSRWPGSRSPLWASSSIMMNIEAAPVLPRVVRLVNQRSCGTSKPATCMPAWTLSRKYSLE